MTDEINENEKFFNEMEIFDEAGQTFLNKILQKVIRILQDELGVSESTVENIGFNTNLEKECKLDSVSMMELSLSIEHEYAIEISEEDLAELKTVGCVVKQIYEKTGKDDLN